MASSPTHCATSTKRRQLSRAATRNKWHATAVPRARGGYIRCEKPKTAASWAKLLHVTYVLTYKRALRSKVLSVCSYHTWYNIKRCNLPQTATYVHYSYAPQALPISTDRTWVKNERGSTTVMNVARMTTTITTTTSNTAASTTTVYVHVFICLFRSSLCHCIVYSAFRTTM